LGVGDGKTFQRGMVERMDEHRTKPLPAGIDAWQSNPRLSRDAQKKRDGGRRKGAGPEKE